MTTNFKKGDTIRITGLPPEVKNIKQLLGIEPIGYEQPEGRDEDATDND